MANFNDRLIKLETAVAGILERLWEMDHEPLVPDDGESGVVEESPQIKKLREQIRQLEVERKNLINDGANVIDFPQK